MIFTFYSYKGGVGRSMALANVAELLYQDGNKVLIVDWDLEAPGLERFFPVKLDSVLAKPGVIDILLEYKKRMSEEITQGKEELLFPDLDQYLVELHPPKKGQGRLWLLPAGKRSGKHFAQYANNVRSFNWQDFYESWDGELYFEKMRQQFEQKADFVLIDSRTGVTEMGGVCAYQFADVMMMFCAPNQQNLDGTFEMATSLKRDDVIEFRKNRPLQLLIVPSRVEDRAEKELLEAFRDTFAQKFNSFLPELSGKIDFWNLRIPHVPFYSFNESVIARETGKIRSEDMLEAFRTLARTMARLSLSGPNREKASDTRRQNNVLIVDNEIEWRQRLYDILGADYYIELVDNYDEAIRKIETQKPPFDVVITEINLSNSENYDIDNEMGLDLLKSLTESNRNTRIIILSRYLTIRLVKTALASGAYDVFEKTPWPGKDFDYDTFRKLVKSATAAASINDIYVAMPFSKTYESIYALIQNVFEEIGLKCRRADEFFSTSPIIDDIQRHIRDSRFILADISEGNPNVLFEVGVAHALGKNVILITRTEDNVPQLLFPFRFIFYENSLSGAAKLQIDLQKNVEKYLQHNKYPSIFSKVAFVSKPNTCMLITPNTDEGKDTAETIIEPVVSNLGLRLISIQDFSTSINLLNKIWENMNNAEFVIADMSDRDPNIYYMIGLAYGLKKKFLLLVRDAKMMPFDLRTSSILQYSMHTEAERSKARGALNQVIRNLKKD